MITKEQYEAYQTHSKSLWKDDLEELVKALRNVAQAARGVSVHWLMSPASEGTGLEAGFYDHLGDMAEALDAMPQWVLDTEDDRD